MAPNQSRQGGADLALRQQLAEVKRVPLAQVGRIRMTPEKMPSLVDVGVILTGKDTRQSAEVFRRMFEAHPDLETKCVQIKFGGRGNRDTPVPQDLATLIEIIFLLPGRAAAQVRRAAAQLFVRYLGGDLSLIGEVEHLNHVQAFLRENAPEHPMRVFGEAVETAKRETSERETAALMRKWKKHDKKIPIGNDPTDDEPLIFSDVVKKMYPNCAASQLKVVTRLAFHKFLELVAMEECRTMQSVCADLKDSTFGQKAIVPSKWESLAQAAVKHVLAPASSSIPTGDIDREKPPTPPERESKRPRVVSFVAEDEHGDAKNAANAMWIGKLRVGSDIFYLDSWQNREGLQLRTTGALLRAGHMARNLFSANPDEAIVAQLCREGVTVRQGDWAGFPSRLFGGIYLDLCSGSWSYVSVQLEHATARSSHGCVLGITMTERDFTGEALLLRTLRLQEFLTNLGWKPAMQSLYASTLLHRSGASKQQVLTQFWSKKE